VSRQQCAEAVEAVSEALAATIAVSKPS
jgi:hypothetical protein